MSLERAWEIECLPPRERRRAIRELGWANERAYYRALVHRLRAEGPVSLGWARWRQLLVLAELGESRGILEDPPLPGQLELEVS